MYYEPILCCLATSCRLGIVAGGRYRVLPRARRTWASLRIRSIMCG